MACSDDDSEATPTPSVCDQAEAVRESVEQLVDLDAVIASDETLIDAVDNVRNELQALRETASDAIRPEITALETAVDDARDTLSSIDDEADFNETITAIENAIGGIASAASELAGALNPECS
jgi:hypothetical protein